MLVDRIKETAQKELSGADEQSLDRLWNRINTVFQKWKLEHGDRNPKMVDAQLDFRRRIRTPDPIPFEDAEPWECAGLEAPSLSGLTLKLWDEKYPEFMEIIEGKDACKALALLITKTPTPTIGFPKYEYAIRVADLYEALELLIHLQKSKLISAGVKAGIEVGGEVALLLNRDKIKAGEKLQESLSMGNPAAAKKKTEKAADHHKQWRQWALDFFKNGPSWWGVDEVLDKVCDLVEEHKHTMANGKPYARRTIGDVITGVKKTLKTKK